MTDYQMNGMDAVKTYISARRVKAATRVNMLPL